MRKQRHWYINVCLIGSWSRQRLIGSRSGRWLLSLYKTYGIVWRVRSMLPALPSRTATRDDENLTLVTRVSTLRGPVYSLLLISPPAIPTPQTLSPMAPSISDGPTLQSTVVCTTDRYLPYFCELGTGFRRSPVTSRRICYEPATGSAPRRDGTIERVRTLVAVPLLRPRRCHALFLLPVFSQVWCHSERRRAC